MRKNYLLIVFMLIICITGCNGKNEVQKEKLKCDVFKCIELIDYTDKVESINDKIGITSKKNEYVNNSYEWDLSSDVKLRATYGADGITTLELIFDKSRLNDETINTSSFKNLDSDAIWNKLFGEGHSGYKNAVAVLGKEGTIISRKYMNFNGTMTITTDYLWIKNDKCYIRGSYDQDDHWAGSEIMAGTDVKDAQC